MLTSSKLHLTLTSSFKQCGSRVDLLVETFVQICTKRTSTLIKPVHQRWTPLLPVSPVDGLCPIDKVKPSLIEWLDPWYCSHRLFSTLIQPAAARVWASGPTGCLSVERAEELLTQYGESNAPRSTMFPSFTITVIIYGRLSINN